MDRSGPTSKPSHHVASGPEPATRQTRESRQSSVSQVDNLTWARLHTAPGELVTSHAPGAPGDHIGNLTLARHYLQAKSAGGGGPPARTKSATGAAVAHGLGGGGEPLDPETRARFGARFDEDFGGVRVHAGANAAQAANDLEANAFTFGEDVVFAHGRYQPGTPRGDQLIAHELAHVVQQRRAPSPAQAQSRISGAEDSTEREADDVAARAVAGERVSVTQTPSAEVSRDENEDAHPAGTVEQRAEAVKATIRASAKHRLQRNREALAAWSTYLSTRMAPFQVQSQATAQRAVELYRNVSHAQSRGGGMREAMSFERWALTPGRNMREVMERMIRGEIHGGCQQCHEENFARGADFEDEARGIEQIAPVDLMMRLARMPQAQSPFGDDRPTTMSPLEQARTLANAPDIDPDLLVGGRPGPLPALSDEDRARYFGVGPMDPDMFPATELVMQSVAAIRPYLDLLGSTGYNVLTRDPIGTTPGEALADIQSMIEERRSDYAKLATAIEAGDVEWWELTPIVNDVLPMADAEAQKALQQEMEDRQLAATVKAAILIGVSIALLLVAVLAPPTAPVIAGVSVGMITAGAGILLSGYQLGEGIGELSHAQDLLLGEGANDVLSASDLEGARQMAAIGLSNVILGSVGLGTSTSAFASSVKAGAVITRGPWTARISLNGREFIAQHESGMIYVVGEAKQGATAYAFINGNWEQVFATPGWGAADAATAGFGDAAMVPFGSTFAPIADEGFGSLALATSGESRFPLVLSSAEPPIPYLYGSTTVPYDTGSAVFSPVLLLENTALANAIGSQSPFLLGPKNTHIGGALSNESLNIIELRYGSSVRAQVVNARTQSQLDTIGRALGGRRNVFLADISELAAADMRTYGGELVVRSRGTGTTPGMDLLSVTANGEPTLIVPEVKMGASKSPYRIGASALPNAYRDKQTFYDEINAVLTDRTIPIETRVRIQLAVNEGRIRWELDAFGNVQIVASGTDAFPGTIRVNRPVNVPK